MRELAVIRDGAGSIREVANMARRSASVGSRDNVWKHFATQAPILRQAFSGHSGQGLPGLWHGISPIPTEAEDSVTGSDKN